MAKTVSKKPKKTISASRPKNTSRRLKTGNYKSFRLQKRIKHPRPKLSGSFKILRASIRVLLKNWKLFGGIVLIYIILDVVMVKSLSTGSDIPELKQTFQDIFGGDKAGISTGVTLFGYLLGSAGSSATELAGAYQSMLLVVFSLALIWSLRQVYAKTKVGIRDAFYKGLYPLVPFLLVLLVIALQMLPLFAGSYLYSAVITGGLAVTGLEKILWIVLIFLLALLSLYMICSSVFALYIATLPDMRPMQALRSARELVRYRRWLVLRKVLFLPLLLLVGSGLLTVPVILYLTPLAEAVFFILTMLGLPLIHSYMYTLYRELL